MATVEKRKEDIEIDFVKLIQYYLKHFVAILVSGAVAAMAVLIFTAATVTPMYRSNITIYVSHIRNSQNNTITEDDLWIDGELSERYMTFIDSKTILEEVIRLNGLDCSAAALQNMISAYHIDETEIFDVFVQYPDAEMAAQIANTLADIGPAKIADVVKGSCYEILEYADPAGAPYNVNYKKSILLGGILGVVFMGGWLTLRYLLDMSIQDEDELSACFDEPVLGAIPTFEYGRKRSHHTHCGGDAGSAGTGNRGGNKE